jgi:hypothetical protein
MTFSQVAPGPILMVPRPGCDRVRRDGGSRARMYQRRSSRLVSAEASSGRLTLVQGGSGDVHGGLRTGVELAREAACVIWSAAVLARGKRN